VAQASKGLQELFHDTLKDIYFAAKAARSSELKASAP
jgi:ferritin-like metal-binding protein YciE